ncbi:hypothetical protein FJTKL_02644 [Diaporthe vaccinii]|uniref:Uncharacterized protein n=1 Tax=Diaporthe vaccinii TaxID=105482 RepID=A0ABR4DXL6_9PEZI
MFLFLFQLPARRSPSEKKVQLEPALPVHLVKLVGHLSILGDNSHINLCCHCALCCSIAKHETPIQLASPERNPSDDIPLHHHRHLLCFTSLYPRDALPSPAHHHRQRQLHWTVSHVALSTYCLLDTRTILTR